MRGATPRTQGLARSPLILLRTGRLPRPDLATGNSASRRCPIATRRPARATTFRQLVTAAAGWAGSTPWSRLTPREAGRPRVGANVPPDSVRCLAAQIGQGRQVNTASGCQRPHIHYATCAPPIVSPCATSSSISATLMSTADRRTPSASPTSCTALPADVNLVFIDRTALN